MRNWWKISAIATTFALLATLLMIISWEEIVVAEIKVLPDKEVAPKKNIVKMKVTAYCPCKKCCGPCADGITSTGQNAWKTVGVAADPKLLSYGTKLNIPGVGIRKVDDTGGAMRQSAKNGICHIDVRFHNHQEALNFGVQWLEVEILNY